MTKLAQLEDLYIGELRDLYHAETQLVRTLPIMAEVAATPALRQAFKDDMVRAEQHLERLQMILNARQQDPSGHRCKGMEGLLEEGRERLEDDTEPSVLDAGLIVMAQKAQHYEMAGYGSACEFAELLHHPDEAKLLHQTLEEEKTADGEFSQIAKRAINLEAAMA